MSQSRPTQNPSAARAEGSDVNPENMPVITHAGCRVVTTALLAKLYGTEAKYVQKNFTRNAARFEEGKHFYRLEGAELKAFKNRPDNIGSVDDRPSLRWSVGVNARSLTLWTEHGAARHAKMLDTDQAWDVFGKLEDCYFSQVEQEVHRPSSSPAPAEQEDPDTDADFVVLRYQGIKIRVMHMEGGYWYGAAALARALGRRDAYVITGFLQPWQLSCVPCGGRHIQMVSHTGMLDLSARFREGSELLVWLERKIPHVFSAVSAPQSAPTPEPANPLASVTGDARQLAMDYFGNCRKAVLDAGGQVPSWDATTEQRIADGVAALLLERHRYVLTFGEGGAPKMEAVPFGSVVVDPADGDRLARLVWERVPVEALPILMEAACRRLARLVEGSR